MSTIQVWLFAKAPQVAALREGGEEEGVGGRAELSLLQRKPARTVERAQTQESDFQFCLRHVSYVTLEKLLKFSFLT